MIIGLTGYAGSGKSTVAQHLVAAHGFTLVKFAGPLKAMLRALGLGDRELEGDLKEAPHPMLGGVSPRYAMQTLGTEWGRKLIHSELWVNAAMEVVADVLDHGGKVVLDDCRMPNEAQAIIDCGGWVIRIARPGLGPVNGHSSEAFDLPLHGMMFNDTDKEGLRRATDTLVRSLEEMEPCE